MWNSSSGQVTFQNVPVAALVYRSQVEEGARLAAGALEKELDGGGDPNEQKLEQRELVQDDPEDAEQNEIVEEKVVVDFEGLQILHSDADVAEAVDDADLEIEAERGEPGLDDQVDGGDHERDDSVDDPVGGLEEQSHLQGDLDQEEGGAVEVDRAGLQNEVVDEESESGHQQEHELVVDDGH